MVAEIDYNDSPNCARYELCDWYGGEGFNANFRAVLFDERLDCPSNACPADSISIMAQDLQRDELELACRRLHDQATDFQALFDTNCTPVPDDINGHAEIFVFKDGRSCEDLESAAFGRDPDTCSGIYFEGVPSGPDTVAQLIVTEYTADEYPPDPELSIWNFEHEFGHYLDGRYNLYGGYRGEDASLQWWTEGFAEYFAAETTPYKGLPRFETPYSLTETLLRSGSIPTRYAHRHLADRYLMENHRAFVDELLEFMRRGEYEAYTMHMEGEAPKYEAGWQEWLRQGLVLKQVDGVTVLPSIGLVISWNWVIGAEGYKVQWKSGSEDFDPAREHVVNGHAHTIFGLEVGTQYMVRVIATRFDADDSPPSDVVTATPILATPKLVPGGDTASIDLPALFTGLTSSGLSYSARSSDSSLASVAVVNQELRITSGGTGIAMITVTTAHGNGWTTVQTFPVVIESQ